MGDTRCGACLVEPLSNDHGHRREAHGSGASRSNCVLPFRHPPCSPGQSPRTCSCKSRPRVSPGRPLPVDALLTHGARSVLRAAAAAPMPASSSRVRVPGRWQHRCASITILPAARWLTSWRASPVRASATTCLMTKQGPTSALPRRSPSIELRDARLCVEHLTRTRTVVKE